MDGRFACAPGRKTTPAFVEFNPTEPTITQGFIHLRDTPGHGLTLNEDVARAHLKPGYALFGATPWA